MIPKIRKGTVITARYLNDGFGTVNDLVKHSVSPPRQTDKPVAPEVQNEEPSSEPSSTYTETSRSITTEQVFDQNLTNYAEVDRIDAVSFKNGDGDVIRLVFNN